MLFLPSVIICRSGTLRDFFIPLQVSPSVYTAIISVLFMWLFLVLQEGDVLVLWVLRVFYCLLFCHVP